MKSQSNSTGRTTWIRQIKQGSKKLVRSEDRGPLPGVQEMTSGPVQGLLREASCCVSETEAFLTFLSGSGDVLRGDT